MPSSETIEIRKIKEVIGEKEDLPSLNTRTSLSSRIRAISTKLFGVPHLMHLIGGLGVNDTLTFDTDENKITTLFSDGKYLYAGLYISPGKIVKVDLSTFTEVSVITLESGENEVFSLISDGTYLYAGLDINPSVVIKIDLLTFTIVDRLTLTGETDIHSMCSDGTFLYTGHATSPARITKIDLSTFTIVETLQFDVGENIIYSMHTDGVYLYAGLSTTPGKVVRIDLSLFDKVDTITFATDINDIRCIFSDGLYLYASSNTAPCYVMKIDLLTFTLVSNITLPTGRNYGRSLFSDGTYLYVGLYLAAHGEIAKIDLSTFKLIPSIIGLTVDEFKPTSLYSDGTYLYIGTETSPGRIVRKYLIPSDDVHQKRIDLMDISVRSVISATTSAGLVGGTTIIDTSRTEGDDYWNNLTLLILGGSYKGQSRKISDFDAASDTITVSPAFNGQILSGVRYAILPTGSSSLVTTDILADATPFNGADIPIIKADTQTIEDSTLKAAPTAGSLATFIVSGGVGLGTALPNSKSLYDFLLTTDNNYSTTGVLNFTTEKTVFEIATDTRYQILNPWIDMTPFTATATITFQFYRSVVAGGVTYRKAGDTITKVVDTDNPIVEFADWSHYGYTKLTIISNNAGDNAVDVKFGYIKKPLE